MQIGSSLAIPAIDAATPASATTQSHGSGSVKVGSAVTAETGTTAASGVSGGASTSGVSSSISSSKSASQSHPSVLSPLEEALAAVYTTSVAGHDFLGTVQQTAGEYVASVPNPPDPPITGIGSSIQAAENNLTVVIDEIV